MRLKNQLTQTSAEHAEALLMFSKEVERLQNELKIALKREQDAKTLLNFEVAKRRGSQLLEEVAELSADRDQLNATIKELREEKAKSWSKDETPKIDEELLSDATSRPQTMSAEHKNPNSLGSPTE